MMSSSLPTSANRAMSSAIADGREPARGSPEPGDEDGEPEVTEVVRDGRERIRARCLENCPQDFGGQQERHRRRERPPGGWVVGVVVPSCPCQRDGRDARSEEEDDLGEGARGHRGARDRQSSERRAQPAPRRPDSWRWSPWQVIGGLSSWVEHLRQTTGSVQKVSSCDGG